MVGDRRVEDGDTGRVMPDRRQNHLPGHRPASEPSRRQDDGSECVNAHIDTGARTTVRPSSAARQRTALGAARHGLRHRLGRHPMIFDVEPLYLQHLTEADRRLIATVSRPGSPLSTALGDPALEEAVFGPTTADATRAAMSPFLCFAVAVHGTRTYLDNTTYVEERWTPRTRIPVFDVGPLRALLADPGYRLFLAELLGSYTHVTSGAIWQRTRRGWRRRRFSELDPVRLAELLEAVTPEERAGIYRRLGDLALFLTGVFPDYHAFPGTGQLAADRLLRLSGLRPDHDAVLGPELLGRLGPRWYAMAARSAATHGTALTTGLAVAAEMGKRFGEARRVLNVVSDRYLFPLRERWFGLS